MKSITLNLIISTQIGINWVFAMRFMVFEQRKKQDLSYTQKHDNLPLSKALIRRDNYKSSTFFCFSKGEKDSFQKKRFYFKKNHLKRISLKWKGFLHQMKRNSTLKWKGFTFLKSRWNEMKRKLFLPTPLRYTLFQHPTHCKCSELI